MSPVRRRPPQVVFTKETLFSRLCNVYKGEEEDAGLLSCIFWRGKMHDLTFLFRQAAKLRCVRI